jgi:uncharacterized protein (DUF58 family)
VPPDEGAGRPHVRIEDRLGGLRWPVVRPLGVHPSGEERSRGLGAGLEYADSREYVPGDDPRQIDWNLSARSGRTFIRLAHPERGLDAWLLVDVSRSLDWGTSRCLKREAAADLVVAASMLLARRGNRVGAILFDERVRQVLPPAAGRRSRAAVVAAARAEPPASPAAAETALASALGYASRLVRRPSLLIVISDFMAADGWQLQLRSLGLRHELICAVISDPREEDLPDIGLVTFEDPESGRQLEVDTRSAALRERFRTAALDRRARLRTDLVAAHAVPFEITTSEDVVNQLIRLFSSIATQAQARRRSVAP